MASSADSILYHIWPAKLITPFYASASAPLNILSTKRVWGVAQFSHILTNAWFWCYLFHQTLLTTIHTFRSAMRSQGNSILFRMLNERISSTQSKALLRSIKRIRLLGRKAKKRNIKNRCLLTHHKQLLKARVVQFIILQCSWPENPHPCRAVQ